MWRKLFSSSQLKTLTLGAAVGSCRSAYGPGRLIDPAPISVSASPFLRNFSSTESAVQKKKVEDVMPIATGHEREELEAELEGKNLLDINFPVGPFGTKDTPAVVKSYYDRRIVGCPGGEDEDEHDVVWFWLEKGKPHECPVCSQYFVLQVVGPGGSPDGHDDDHH